MNKDKKGFTLIELIMVITILGVLSAGLAGFITTAMDSWVFIKARETALSYSRNSIERMVREIRRVKKPTNIITAATTECKFVDINYNTVCFSQEGTNLRRNNDIMTTGVSSPEGLKFSYFNASMEAVILNQDIRFIKVRLYLKKGTQGVTLEDGARIRNL